MLKSKKNNQLTRVILVEKAPFLVGLKGELGEETFFVSNCIYLEDLLIAFKKARIKYNPSKHPLSKYYTIMESSKSGITQKGRIFPKSWCKKITK